MDFPHKNIRLSAARYKGAQRYFVTLCCAGRRPVLRDAGRASWIVEGLRDEAASHDFAVYAYSAMPDHLHALVIGMDDTADLLAFMKALKQKTAYEFRKKFRRDLWQKKFYDHILRQNDSIHRVAGYIWMNPVRKGICSDPLDYPYSGSFVIDWKKGVVPVETWVPPWKEKEEPLRGKPRPA